MVYNLQPPMKNYATVQRNSKYNIKVGGRVSASKQNKIRKNKQIKSSKQDVHCTGIGIVMSQSELERVFLLILHYVGFILPHSNG